MKLSPADIKRLYGDKLFILPEPERVEAIAKPQVEEKEESSPALETVIEEVQEKKVAAIDLSSLQSGQKPVWKMKPGARLALILRKSEFTNKALTGILKESMVKAAINLKHIGFGVIEDQVTSLDLSDMGVPFAVLCDKLDQKLNSPVEMELKKIWLSPSLANVASDPSAKTELDSIMKEIAGGM
ncbi:MAG: hypothetical protein AAFR87_10560 [Bacteroidota bacterium]